MKLLITLLLLVNTAFASMPAKTNPEPNYFNPFKALTAKQYGELRGKKLNFVERAAYNAARKKALQDPEEGETPNPNRFNWLGFFLGIVFPYGLIASYFFKDKSVRRSAWIGAGVALVVACIILLSYAGKVN